MDGLKKIRATKKKREKWIGYHLSDIIDRILQWMGWDALLSLVDTCFWFCCFRVSRSFIRSFGCRHACTSMCGCPLFFQGH
jgi:hypothetical protein